MESIRIGLNKFYDSDQVPYQIDHEFLPTSLNCCNVDFIKIWMRTVELFRAVIVAYECIRVYDLCLNSIAVLLLYNVVDVKHLTRLTLSGNEMYIVYIKRIIIPF